MKRAFIGLAVAALTSLSFVVPAFAAPASAASSPDIYTYNYSGTYAGAAWSHDSSTGATTEYTGTMVNVSNRNQGSHLYLRSTTQHWGDGTSWERVLDVDATSGFSLKVTPWDSASLSAQNLLVTITFTDFVSGQETVEYTTVDVKLTWTGQGTITHGVYTTHTSDGYVTFTSHSNGFSRLATATGTITGITLDPADLFYADMGRTSYGAATITFRR